MIGSSVFVHTTTSFTPECVDRDFDRHGPIYTFDEVNTDVIAWMLGWPANWVRRPRMKRRAARRIAGYTRTGQRRR